jgi:hypothetical protein
MPMRVVTLPFALIARVLEQLSFSITWLLSAQMLANRGESRT